MDETQGPVPQSIKDEVLRKVGRNLLLNQELEQLLKFILGLARIEGTPADAATRLEARQTTLVTTSMGGLQRRFRTEVLATVGQEKPVSQGPDNLTQPWLCTTLQFELAPTDKAALEAELDALTIDRNELAHHFLPRWQPNSRELMVATSAHLDAQRERILAIRRRLKGMHESITEALSAMANYWASSEGTATMELVFLQGSRLMELLCETSAKPQRADGWTDLAYAAAVVHRLEPDAMTNRKTLYGEQSLKALVIKSQLFEVTDEPLPRGVRTLIRPIVHENHPA